MPELPFDQRPLQAVLLDFEDTLGYYARPAEDLAQEGAAACAETLRGAGLSLPDDFATQWLRALDFAATKSIQEEEEHTADDTLAFLVQFYGYTALDRKLVRRAVDQHYAPAIAAAQAVPGALDVLQTLHAAGYRLGVVANANCDRVVQRAVRQIGARPYVDLVLTSQTVEDRKPRTRLYELALGTWDVAPYQAVALGDRLDEDVAPAQAAGLRGVLLTWREHPSNRRQTTRITPDASIDSWQALPPLLARWQEEDAAHDDSFWAGGLPLQPPPVPEDFDPEAPLPEGTAAPRPSAVGPELDAETLAAILFGEGENEGDEENEDSSTTTE